MCRSCVWATRRSSLCTPLMPCVEPPTLVVLPTGTSPRRTTRRAPSAAGTPASPAHGPTQRSPAAETPSSTQPVNTRLHHQSHRRLGASELRSSWTLTRHVTPVVAAVAAGNRGEPPPPSQRQPDYSGAVKPHDTDPLRLAHRTLLAAGYVPQRRVLRDRTSFRRSCSPASAPAKARATRSPKPVMLPAATTVLDTPPPPPLSPSSVWKGSEPIVEYGAASLVLGGLYADADGISTVVSPPPPVPAARNRP